MVGLHRLIPADPLHFPSAYLSRVYPFPSSSSLLPRTCFLLPRVRFSIFPHRHAPASSYHESVSRSFLTFSPLTRKGNKSRPNPCVLSHHVFACYLFLLSQLASSSSAFAFFRLFDFSCCAKHFEAMIIG